MSDGQDNKPVTVKILDKEYQVACSPEERADLLDSAEYLSLKMREIRDSGKVVGLDRVAVMAALNLTHELLQIRDSNEALSEAVTERVRALRERVEVALEKGRQMEL